MKYLSLLLLTAVISLGCTPDYQVTQATITALETNYDEAGNFRATIEYSVDKQTYTDYFEIHMMKLVEDSLSTPAPGIVFDIKYNPRDPKENKIDFQVKANYNK